MSQVNGKTLTLDDFVQLQALLNYEQAERDRHIRDCQSNKEPVLYVQSAPQPTTRHVQFRRDINPQASLQSSLESARLAEASMKLKWLKDQYKRQRALEVQMYLEYYRRQALIRTVLEEAEEMYYRQCIAAALEKARIQLCLQQFLDTKRLQEVEEEEMYEEQDDEQQDLNGYTEYHTQQLENLLEYIFDQQNLEEIGYQKEVPSEEEQAKNIAQVWKFLSDQQESEYTPRTEYLSSDEEETDDDMEEDEEEGEEEDTGDEDMAENEDIDFIPLLVEQIKLQQQQLQQQQLRQQQLQQLQQQKQQQKQQQQLDQQEQQRHEQEYHELYKQEKNQIDAILKKRQLIQQLQEQLQQKQNQEKQQQEDNLQVNQLKQKQDNQEEFYPVKQMQGYQEEQEQSYPVEQMLGYQKEQEKSYPPVEQTQDYQEEQKQEQKKHQEQEQKKHQEQEQKKRKQEQEPEQKQEQSFGQIEQEEQPAKQIEQEEQLDKDMELEEQPAENIDREKKLTEQTEQEKQQAQLEEKKSDQTALETQQNHASKAHKKNKKKKNKKNKNKKKNRKHKSAHPQQEVPARKDTDFPPVQDHVVPLQKLIHKLASEPVLIGEQRTQYSDEPKPSGIWAKDTTVNNNKPNVKSPTLAPLSTTTDDNGGNKAPFLPQHIFTEAEPTPTLENMPNTPLGTQAEEEDVQQGLEHFVNTVAAEQKNEVVPPDPRMTKTFEELESVSHLLSDPDSEIVKRWKSVLEGGKDGKQKLSFSKENEGTLLLTATTPFNRQFLGSEDELLRTMIRLDGVESFGDPSIRAKRKKLVKTCESMLDELDKYKQSQWEKAMMK